MMNFDRTPASVLILGAILVMSALALWVAPALMDRNLLRPYWLIRRRQYDTIITSGFIHGDFGHLLFNSLTFFFFAPALERRIGTPKFFALYFVGLVLSSLGTIYKQRNNPDYAALGASGRHPCGAVRVHRLLPEADALSVLRDSDSGSVICLRLCRVQLVGVEKPA